MKQQTYIHIPEPCHENWNAMTPEGQGRFCASCTKTVVDFTAMTDTQVLNHLNAIKGNTCGRFKDEQLERAMQEDAKKKKSGWQWVLAVLAAFVYVNKSAAQTNNVQPKPITAEHKEPETMMFLGKVAPRIIPEEKKGITIRGIVKDIEGMPIQNASITIDGSAHIITDAYGQFVLTKPKNRSKSTLEVSYVGNKTEKVTVSYADTVRSLIITLTPEQSMLPEIVVKSETVCTRTSITGGAVMMVTKVTTMDTLVANFKSRIGIAAVYPNPALKGSQINIRVDSAGDYAIQLLGTNGALVGHQQNSVLGKQSVCFSIPANLASGSYYIRIINNTTKKQSTEKIIVL